jgi:hypothetical protein
MWSRSFYSAKAGIFPTIANYKTDGKETKSKREGAR